MDRKGTPNKTSLNVWYNYISFTYPASWFQMEFDVSTDYTVFISLAIENCFRICVLD